CDGARGIDNRHDDANGEHEGRKKDADKTHNTTKPLEALASRHKPRGFTLQSCYKDLIVYITCGVGSPVLRLPAIALILCALASPLGARPHPELVEGRGHQRKIKEPPSLGFDASCR